MSRSYRMQMLKKQLEERMGCGFIFHTEFVRELGHLLTEASGNEARLFKDLVKQFNYVSTLNLQVNNADSNEILRHVPDFSCYSLHLASAQYNIRLLMTFITNDEGNLSPLFLVAFNEQAGKKHTGYAPVVEKAKQRRKSILEGDPT